MDDEPWYHDRTFAQLLDELQALWDEVPEDNWSDPWDWVKRFQENAYALWSVSIELSGDDLVLDRIVDMYHRLYGEESTNSFAMDSESGWWDTLSLDIDALKEAFARTTSDVLRTETVNSWYDRLDDEGP